ncbi:MAG TPA: serine/threonine-protein kinase [Polyangia bacterium]|nr:serine/threonine-protein kinase [Polyangia bacterium]
MPDQFGKYTVLRHLASGGMADLFLARATGIVGFEKIVVIKRIREDLLGDHEITELFLHEARLAAALEHPHIAQVYDVGMVNDSYFFAMEYVHGVDLRKIMRTLVNKKETLPLADAVQIGVGVCAALHYAHEKRSFSGESLGIIHRDVSPSNVLVSYDGAVKVCDFGVAKATNRSQQTAHGVLKGKISYMSPEQCQCRPLDRRSDIFAIAIVLYELTTLNKLFRGDSDMEVIKQLTEGRVTPPSTLRPDYPPELERIIMKALSHDADARYATAQEMQLDLEAFAREQRLALSSVSIERLMARLFEGHVEAWQEALRRGKDLGQHLLDRPPSLPSATPVSHGTPTPTPSGSLVIETGQPQTSLQVSLSSRASHATTGETALWSPARLGMSVGVVLLLVAGGALVPGAHGVDADATTTLQTEADRLGALLDSEARALQMRADGIATMPMLRAAIGTDANTMKDMASSELVFTSGKHEVVELFQVDGPKTTSLLRLPAGARALQPIVGRETRVDIVGDKLVIDAGAPVLPLYRARATGGAIAIDDEIDLSALRRRLQSRVLRAWLRGPHGIVPLVTSGGRGELSSLSLPLPSSAELSLADLSLEAVPLQTTARWHDGARYGLWLLAAAVALALMLELRRQRHRR